MLDVPPDDHARWSSGPFYEVDDVERFVSQHPQLSWVGEAIDVPGGRSASLSDPAGNIIHIFDQTAPTTTDATTTTAGRTMVRAQVPA
jgi:hypothetical protein